MRITISVGFLYLAFSSVLLTGSLAHSPRFFAGTITRVSPKKEGEWTAAALKVRENDYQSDIDRMIGLRSHPLNELIAFAEQLESKWRRVDWNSYARIVRHICSEISNRGLNDARVRQASERFAKIAVSHSTMYLWEHEAALVSVLGYQQMSSNPVAWVNERREKSELWLHALRRLQKETDPSFDIEDRKNQPSLRVYPPFEIGLPPGTLPTAIKDQRLRAKYEVELAENKRKSLKIQQQLPLRLHGPSFKALAERWLVQAYSQPPLKNAELRRYLDIYIQDTTTRNRILSELEKNAK